MLNSSGEAGEVAKLQLAFEAALAVSSAAGE